MKKIINGKRYDTATATRLAHYESSVPVGDFDWFEEDLYRKKSGEFFIHGQGNAASRYSRPAATGGSAGGEGIIPLTYEQAAAWGEAHMDAGQYEAVFGEVSEDGGKTVLSLSVSSAASDTARRNAAQAGITLSAYIERLIMGQPANPPEAAGKG